MEKKQLKVNCPSCKKKVDWDDQSKYRPFCSERCQQLDLGAWANESYGIPAEPGDQWSNEVGVHPESGIEDSSSPPSPHTLQ